MESLDLAAGTCLYPLRIKTGAQSTSATATTAGSLRQFVVKYRVSLATSLETAVAIAANGHYALTALKALVLVIVKD